METTPITGQLIGALTRIRIQEDLEVASMALFAYDYLLTLSMEIELVWMSPWNTVKVLYLVQRYMPFTDASVFPLLRIGATSRLHVPGAAPLTVNFCRSTYGATGFMYGIGMITSELILTLRAWAIWRNDKRLGYVLPVFCLLCWIPALSITGMFVNSLQFDLAALSSLGCLVSASNPNVYMIWVLLTVFEAVILILILIPGISAYRSSGNSGLFKVVFRDGVLYYVYLFILSAVNVIVILTLPPDSATLLTSLERVIHSMLTSRVVLHIRAHAKKDVVYIDGQTDIQMPTTDVETLEFQRRTQIVTHGTLGA